MVDTDLIDTLPALIDDAEQRIRPYVVTTPLDRLHLLCDETAAAVLIKCEHLQNTGSFKVRGAMSKLLSLSPAERDRGVITASTGNHGQGVAFALAAVGGLAGRGTVYVPHGASPVKVAAIERYGVEVRHVGQESGETEREARAAAEREGRAYISPYNDPVVIAGQGTIGLELIAQCPDGLDAVVVAVGGGGLISGIAASVKRAWPGLEMIAAAPRNDAAMFAAVQAGRVVPYDSTPTLSDGTAGGIDDDAVTLALCAQLVDRWVLVGEDEIRAALRLVIDSQHQLVEGAAATAVAATRRLGAELAGKRVAVISCGGNISSDRLAEALRAG